MSALFLALLLPLLWACSTPRECDEERPCGLTETCVDGQCVAQVCATSAQCPMEQHCDGGVCVPGCAEDGDCLPGEACAVETGTCEAAECEDSHVDCGFQEYCDTSSGECYRAEGYWCAACDDDADCGGGDNICRSWGDNGRYCAPACEVQDDCPSGYSCTPIPDSAGNVQGSWCITWCWLYEEQAR